MLCVHRPLKWPLVLASDFHIPPLLPLPVPFLLDPLTTCTSNPPKLFIQFPLRRYIRPFLPTLCLTFVVIVGCLLMM